jgi:iron complex transport system substrate-binding protein
MELSEELQERVDIIRHKLKFIEQKPTVACVKQLDPLTLWAEQMPELVDIAGGASIATGNIQWEELEQQNPDIFIVMLEGLTVEQSMKEINQLLQLPGFTELKAVKNNRFYIADGNRYFDNSDASLVDYVELLAEIINPKQFVFGYEGEGWIKFNIT